MTIVDIYEAYQIMPSLATHMYRVAGVAKLIGDHWQGELNLEQVLAATLLHDMGNILKFDLSKFPEFCQPEGQAHWESIKADYEKKYGRDEHQATQAIIKELGVSTRVQELIRAISFTQTEVNYLNHDYEAMVCHYADLRVTPFQVVSLTTRLDDLEQRYGEKYSSAEDQEQRRAYGHFAAQMEKALFVHCSLAPAEITEEAVQKLRPQLEGYLITA
jgi:5'-deoxynucleotidase YfbR-like HD superfamily hydrolase